MTKPGNIADVARPMLDNEEVMGSDARKTPWQDVVSCIPQGFSLEENGLYRKTNNGDEQVSGAVWVSAKTRDPQSEEWGIVVEWIDPDGKQHKQAFPRNLLHDKKGIALIQALSAGGLEVIPGCENAVVKYLGSFDIANRLRSVAQLGWLRGEELVFVLPNRVIGKDAGSNIVYQPERYSPTCSTMGSRGTLAQWQMNVAVPCRNNDYLIFALCQSFAGSLLEFSNMESGGFHLYGASSKGKTTALQCAASVWGNGADPAASHETYIRKWNTTGNALEATAAHNDGILILDELGTCSVLDIGKIVYDLFGGQGKARMGKDASLLYRRSWRFVGLSSGEVSVQQRIEREGRHVAHAGQLIRFIDIPIDGGIVRDTHGQTSSAFVKQLKESCAKYYGTAGSAFLNKFVDYFGHHERAMHDVCESVEYWVTAVAHEHRGLTALQERALQRFALVKSAGILAVEFEILPFNIKEIDESILSVWRAWLDDASNLSDADRGVRNVREFLQKHGASRFDSGRSYESLIRDCAGYRHKDLFLFNDVGFRDACGEFETQQVAAELKKRRLLIVDDHNRFKSKHSLPGQPGRQRFYAVRETILEDD